MFSANFYWELHSSFLFKIFIFIILCVCVFAHVDVCHMGSCAWGCQSPHSWSHRQLWASWHRCLKLNLGPLEGQQVFQIAETFLQSWFLFFELWSRSPGWLLRSFASSSHVIRLHGCDMMLVYLVLEIEPRALCMLSSHSANSGPSPALGWALHNSLSRPDGINHTKWRVILFYLLLTFLVVAEMKPRASCKVGGYSTTELSPQQCSCLT